MENKTHNEPLFRIEKRSDATWKEKIIVGVIFAAIAFVISLLFILIVSKKNPFEAIGIMFKGSFGSSVSFQGLLKQMILLFAIALALVPAYKMKFWNIGAQGQVLMGALVTAYCMIKFNQLPNWVLLLLSLVLSILLGGLWALIPAYFKAKHNTNETLFTLMMNYIAIRIVSFAVENWRGDKSSMGVINGFTEKGWLPEINNNPNILPMIYVILLMVFIFIYIEKSKHGYEIRVVGESTATAKYAGLNVNLVMIRTLALSGALCGVVGFIYTAGFDHAVSASTGGSYGFTAIIVCWLSQFNPFVMSFFAFFICFLNKGASSLSDYKFAENMNNYACEFIIFTIILCIMAAKFFVEYKLIIRKKVK